MKIIRSLGLAIGLSILSLSANAAAIYTYNGLTYTLIVDNSPPAGTYTTAMSITAEFTFASALAPSMSFTDVTSLVQSFSMSDGRNTITDANAFEAFEFRVATNTLGQISEWGFSSSLGSLANLGGQLWTISSNKQVGFVVDDGIITQCTATAQSGCTTTLSDVGQRNFSSGSWTMTTVSMPEPGTLSLLAIGLVGVAWVRRRMVMQ